MSSEVQVPMQKYLRERGSEEPVDDKEMDALIWQVSYALRGEKWLDFDVRRRISQHTTPEQRESILRNALAQVAQSQMDPRKSDPNYPLD